MSHLDIQLETPRLLLRMPCAGDFEAWAAFRADEEVARYIGGPEARPMAWRSLAAMIGAWHLRGFAMFSVIDKATGQWLGRVGPWQPEGWPGTEVGWSIVRAHWGKGFGPEAATASIDWAFDQLGWSEVIHIIDPRNENSKAVAAKLGSRHLRTGRLPVPLDANEVEIWGQSREQWLARRAREERT
ncbi:MAG TPA: GNAT family N-acetyltransferase [Lysobacter sp.]